MTQAPKRYLVSQDDIDAEKRHLEKVKETLASLKEKLENCTETNNVQDALNSSLEPEVIKVLIDITSITDKDELVRILTQTDAEFVGINSHFDEDEQTRSVYFEFRKKESVAQMFERLERLAKQSMLNKRTSLEVAIKYKQKDVDHYSQTVARLTEKKQKQQKAWDNRFENKDYIDFITVRHKVMQLNWQEDPCQPFEQGQKAPDYFEEDMYKQYRHLYAKFKKLGFFERN